MLFPPPALPPPAGMFPPAGRLPPPPLWPVAPAPDAPAPDAPDPDEPEPDVPLPVVLEATGDGVADRELPRIAGSMTSWVSVASYLVPSGFGRLTWTLTRDRPVTDVDSTSSDHDQS